MPKQDPNLIIERSGFLSLEVYQAEGFRLKLWQILLLGLNLLIILLSLLGRLIIQSKAESLTSFLKLIKS
ncbi:MAG: hypothetical protein R2865_09120 [Deinococcales bacterium]